MFGLNKQARVVRSSTGWAAISMAALMNKRETGSTAANKPPVCVRGEPNGINWLALCGGCKVPWNASVEGRHVDNEAVTAKCQRRPWTSTGPTVLVTPAAAWTCVDGRTDGPLALPVTSPAPAPCAEMTISLRVETLLISAGELSLINDAANNMFSILIRASLAFAQQKTESKAKATRPWSNVANQHLRPEKARDAPLRSKGFSSWCGRCVLETTSSIEVNSTWLVKTLWRRNN